MSSRLTAHTDPLEQVVGRTDIRRSTNRPTTWPPPLRGTHPPEDEPFRGPGTGGSEGARYKCPTTPLRPPGIARTFLGVWIVPNSSGDHPAARKDGCHPVHRRRDAMTGRTANLQPANRRHRIETSPPYAATATSRQAPKGLEGALPPPGPSSRPLRSSRGEGEGLCLSCVTFCPEYDASNLASKPYGLTPLPVASGCA